MHHFDGYDVINLSSDTMPPPLSFIYFYHAGAKPLRLALVRDIDFKRPHGQAKLLSLCHAHFSLLFFTIFYCNHRQEYVNLIILEYEWFISNKIEDAMKHKLMHNLSEGEQMCIKKLVSRCKCANRQKHSTNHVCTRKSNRVTCGQGKDKDGKKNLPANVNFKNIEKVCLIFFHVPRHPL